MQQIADKAESLLLEVKQSTEQERLENGPGNREEKLLCDIEQLLGQLNRKSHKDAVQGELSKLMLLYPGILAMEDSKKKHNLKPYCLQQFYNCLHTIHLDEPNLNLAINVRRRLRLLALEKSPVKRFFYSAAPEAKALLGLALSTTVLILMTAIIANNASKVFGFPASEFLVVVFGGGLGSVVSILGRIDQFSKMNDSSILFFTGCVRPIIGVGFALFIYGLLQADLLPIIAKDDNKQAAYLALSFLSGFSERFGSNIALKSETTISK